MLKLIALSLLVAFAGKTASAPAPTPAPTRSHDRAPRNKSAEALHRYYLDRFVNEEGFGARRIIPVPPAVLHEDGKNYRVQVWRLIGLMHREDGVIYEPRTDRKKKKRKKWRPLNEVERKAVARLRDRHATVFDGNESPVLFTAVRADRSCLECHAVEEGHLLGAFRFDLVVAGAERNWTQLLSHHRANGPR